MTTHLSKFKNTTLLTKCFVTLSGALVLLTAATRVEAATFQVDYEGELIRVNTVTEVDGIEDPLGFDINLLTRPTRIVGTYTWEDVNRNLLSSSFKFLADNGDIIRDVSFTPEPPSSNNPDSPFGRTTFGDAGEGYATYTDIVTTPAGEDLQKVYIDDRFTYFTLVVDPSGQNSVFTQYLGRFSNYQTTLIPDPTTIPEPASVLGLLLLAGAGASWRRRDSAV